MFDDDLVSKLGSDLTNRFVYLGVHELIHDSRVQKFDFYFNPVNGVINVCHHGCNPTYLSGDVSGEASTTLPPEFNEPFFKLKVWFYSSERLRLIEESEFLRSRNLLSLEEAVKSNTLEFAPMFSAHGSDYRFSDSSKLLLSFTDAFSACDRWIGYADSVGGNAQIFHVTTELFVSFHDAREFFVKYFLTGYTGFI